MSLVISQSPGTDSWALVDTVSGLNAISCATDGSLTFAKGVTITSGDLTATSGNVIVSTAGKGLQIKSGSNAKIGTTSAMTAGSVVVSNTSVTANSVILHARKTTGGTPGNVSYTISAGTSFTLTSTSGTETSTFDYMIVEKG